jgi:hypothetical protein
VAGTILLLGVPNIDFSKMPVERVTPELSGLGQGFRCSRGEFVTYWRQGRIQREINARISQCWVLRSEDSLAGYVTLIADKLDLDQPILIDLFNNSISGADDGSAV